MFAAEEVLGCLLEAFLMRQNGRLASCHLPLLDIRQSEHYGQRAVE
jgi:hypothetical protein